VTAATVLHRTARRVGDLGTISYQPSKLLPTERFASVRRNSSRCWRDCTGRPFGDSQELSRFWQGDRIIRRRPDDGR
jgi:hypothetical protein